MNRVSQTLASAFILIFSFAFVPQASSAETAAVDTQVCGADFDGMNRDQQRTCFYYYRILNQQLAMNLTLLKSGKFDAKVDQKVDQGVSVDQGIRAVDRVVDHNATFGVSIDQTLRAVDQGVPIEQGLH